MKEDMILCGAGGRRQKFYFNPRFSTLPEPVQLELKGCLAALAERVGGTILLEYAEDGDLALQWVRDEDDFYFDEIEAQLAVSRLQKEKAELFLRLKAFYLAFFGDQPCK